MELLKTRLAAAMRELGNMSQSKLAKAASRPSAPVSQQVVQHLLSGRNLTSKHLPAIAEALGVSLEWLSAGKGSRYTAPRRETILVGYIGAGQRVIPPDEGVVLDGGIEPPAGYTKTLAARIKGTSMKPLEPGWLIFYEGEHQGNPLDYLNKLCAVGLEDGSRYIKKLTRKNGIFILKSWSADDIVDAKVVWASPVIEIRPR